MIKFRNLKKLKIDGMMENFWKWLRAYANTKVRDCYQHKGYNDRRCERCNTWTSEIDGCKSLKPDPADKMVDLMTCKKCGHVSKWDCRYMIPILIKTLNN